MITDHLIVDPEQCKGCEIYESRKFVSQVIHPSHVYREGMHCLESGPRPIVGMIGECQRKGKDD
jgi:hypothetical protein